MSDLSSRLGRAAQHVAPRWTAADVARTLPQVHQRRQRRRVRRAAVAGAAALMLLVGMRAWLGRGAVSASAIVFADGSRAEPLDAAASSLRILHQSPTEVTTALPRGRAHFEVTHTPSRRFHVQAGDVEVTVLGTSFTVERIADRVEVEVSRGRVQVTWPGGSRVVATGETGWFPPLAGTDLPAAVVQAAIAAPPPAAGAVPSRTVTVRRAMGTKATSGVEAALEAADDARLAGEPERAAGLLEKALVGQGSDPRTQLVAFTLGRVLMSELRRAGAAAQAFARARAIAPQGPLAEDALAREAEAWRDAGEPQRAGAAAREYRRLYPEGRHRAVIEGLARARP